MRRLLNTLFVLSEDAFLTLDGENLVVKRDKEITARFPIHMLESVISFSYMGASPALMGKCAEECVGLSFFSPQGRFLARAQGKSRGNVLLRKEQYRISDDLSRSCAVSRNMIFGKIYNSRWSLERTIRDHEHRVDANKLARVSSELQEKLKVISAAENLDSLRGMEGELASRYFSVFDFLILNQKEDFTFSGRNRRPPTDYINALLSFVYAILTNDCANALESVGLDCYVGFMHRDHPGRQSLALDLMEELRPIVADRFVISLINLKTIKREHFTVQRDGAVYLNDEGKRVFFAAWQSKKKEELTHPYLKEKIMWGLVPYIQALLLARTIRGDMTEYPPFLWK